MARRRLGVWRRFSVALVKPAMLVFTRRDWRGMEHVPAEGGVILVSNHLSQFDPFDLSHFVYEAGRWPRFLAKASLFTIPVIGSLLRAVRQIPVHRGTVNAARALDDAVAAVTAGKAVIIYPEGTTTRDPDLWPMRGKTGIARLALATGAPVVPIVMWGPQRVFDPRTNRLRLRPRTPVTVVAGAPLDLSEWLVSPPSDGDKADLPQGQQRLIELTGMIMSRLTESLAEVRRDPAQPVAETIVTGTSAETGEKAAP